MADSREKPLGPVGTFVRDTLRAMVAHPEAVRVREIVGETIVKVDFEVHDDDAAAVTGHAGEAIKALRSLTTVVASRQKKGLILMRLV